MAVLALAILASAALAPTHNPRRHPVRGCMSAACDARVLRRDHRRALALRARRRAGMASADASWFEDAGAIACAQRFALGVAHRTLPCGTRVRFCALRCATGRVEDRGPYVAGREWDLTPGLRAATGFGDTGRIFFRVLR